MQYGPNNEKPRRSSMEILQTSAAIFGILFACCDTMQFAVKNSLYPKAIFRNYSESWKTKQGL